MVTFWDLAVEKKLIEKSGTWFSFRWGNGSGQGRENAPSVPYMPNQDILKQVEEKLRIQLGLVKRAPEPEVKEIRKPPRSANQTPANGRQGTDCGTDSQVGVPRSKGHERLYIYRRSTGDSRITSSTC